MNIYNKIKAFSVLALVLFALAAFAGPKYIFLFIGDGMGPGQRQLGEAFAGKKLNINDMPVNGTTNTSSLNSKVTDSAAAGTALACGLKTNNGWIGMIPVKKVVKDKKTGKEIEVVAPEKIDSVVTDLKKQGYKIGLISSVPLNHATPASFYGHVKSRNMYDDLALQMAGSNIDFFGGDQLILKKLKKEDILKKFKENDFEVISEPKCLDSIKPGKKAYVCRKFDFVVDRGDKKPFTLADTVSLAIRMLDNKNGFFIMCEGGRIDWGCHKNDAGAAASETVAFDDAVKVARDFYRKHPDDTLIVVTADHETGGLIFTGGSMDGLHKQKNSYYDLTFKVKDLYKKQRPFKDVLKLVTDGYGLKNFTPEEVADIRRAWEIGWIPVKLRTPEEQVLYGRCSPVLIVAQNKLARQAGAKYISFNHTGQPVQTSAEGVGSNKFAGHTDNTDIPRIIRALIADK